MLKISTSCRIGFWCREEPGRRGPDAPYQCCLRVNWPHIDRALASAEPWGADSGGAVGERNKYATSRNEGAK